MEILLLFCLSFVAFCLSSLSLRSGEFSLLDLFYHIYVQIIVQIVLLELVLEGKIIGSIYASEFKYATVEN